MSWWPVLIPSQSKRVLLTERDHWMLATRVRSHASAITIWSIICRETCGKFSLALWSKPLSCGIGSQTGVARSLRRSISRIASRCASTFSLSAPE